MRLGTVALDSLCRGDDPRGQEWPFVPSFHLPALPDEAKLAAGYGRSIVSHQHHSENNKTMSKPRYDTVLERCSPTTETVLLSFICKQTLSADHVFGNEMTTDRMDEIKEAIESVVTGRKYEVILLRSQGKSMAEIAMLLSISKSTVQNYYRQAIRQVRQALGIEKSDPRKRRVWKVVEEPEAASVTA